MFVSLVPYKNYIYFVIYEPNIKKKKILNYAIFYSLSKLLLSVSYILGIVIVLEIS